MLEENIDNLRAYDEELNNDKSRIRKTLPFTIINTNTRSLGPKIDSLLDCLSETDARIGIVTETWFRDGQELEELRQDLDLGSGLGMICRNRQPNENGVSYGGVAIFWRKSACVPREVPFKNPEDFAFMVRSYRRSEEIIKPMLTKQLW